MKSARAKDKEKVKNSEIIGISFDGRKDLTRALIPDSTGRLHPRIIKEQHISVTAEPSGRYVGHVTPEEPVHPVKPAMKEAEAVYHLMQQHDLTESCMILGGDSTVSNTGWKGGAIANLEKLLGHKCHWCICMLHTNELPFRHLIVGIDGATTSNVAFSGPIGKLLGSVNEMEYQPQFKALPGGEDFIILPKIVLDNMSTDQQLSYKLCNAVKNGCLPLDLREIKCGALNHARWLTTGMRLVYLWTRKHDLSGKQLEDLEILVRFSLESYFKLFFDIKVKDRLEDAPHHILTQLRILRTQSKRVQGIVTPFVCSGAWHSHHENVLLALLASPDKVDRKFGIDQILKLRNGKEIGDLSVRYRKTPKLNLKATTLQDLVSWTSGDIHEPVFTCNLSNEELINILEKPYVTPDVKIHSQSTERAVQQVTEAAKAVVGQEARDGFITARLQHREKMPKFKTKQHIMPLIRHS